MEQNKINYNLNISSLKEHHPEILKKVIDPQVSRSGELLAEQGNLIVPDKDGINHFMHGKTGPLEDSQQFLAMIPENASGVVVMLGFGLGIPCLEILKNRPDLRHLFIFELDPGIFKQALYAYDLSDLFSDNRAIFCLEKEPTLNVIFQSAYKTLELEDIQILRHRPSFKVNPDYSLLSDKIFNYVNAFSISGSTTKAMGKKFVRNRLRNMKRIRNDILINSLKNIFKDMPAILVAGGPSLNKNIEFLKNAKGKAVLFAVDSVVPTLLKKGIIPDFVAAIDPQKITLEKFKGAKFPSDEISLICSAWVTSKVPFHLPSKRVIWTFGGRNIEVWINKILGGSDPYIGAGTVAHLNLHAALDMGCSPIVFVGQDLAYSEAKDHADNVSLNNKTQMESILKSKDDWKWIKGIEGGQVKTSRSFLNNKKVFEDIIKKAQTVKFINATQGGAHIEGTEVETLNDLLSRLPLTSLDIEQQISKHASPIDDKRIDTLDGHFIKMIETGNKILKTIKKTKSTSTDVYKAINDLKKKSKKIVNFAGLPQKVQKKIKKFDSLSAELDSQGIFWHALEEVTMDGLKQSEKMLHDINICAKDKNKFFDWILKNIKRINYINEVRVEIIAWLKKDLSDIIEFHKKEKDLIGFQKSGDNTSKNLQEICQLYFDNSLTSLAVKQFKKIGDISNNANLLFIKGCSLSICGDQKTAEQCFCNAVSLDNDLTTKIKEFKAKQAEQYVKFGKKWKKIDIETSKRFYIKALHDNPEQQAVIKELNNFIKEAVEDTSLLIKDKKFTDAQKALTTWFEILENDSLFAESIGKKHAALLYSNSGKLFVHEEKYEIAYEQFLKATQLDPKNPENFIQLTDLCFSVGDYDKGVTALNIAVQLDRSNAKYWELIGDTLVNSGSVDDALSAYEKCFIEMPERIHLLKKMGDLYLSKGESNAADEAYLQYENKLKNSHSKP